MEKRMGKRSNFERKDRDFYSTPLDAVIPLVPHIIGVGSFSEPCAGNGVLCDHLEFLLFEKKWASDISPQRKDILEFDALALSKELSDCDAIITNPPWDRKILHPMIDNFRRINDTWLLFDADWMHTKQAAPYLKYGQKIVSIGRVKWIPDSKMTGKDNCCWYNFKNYECTPIFYGRKEV